MQRLLRQCREGAPRLGDCTELQRHRGRRADGATSEDVGKETCWCGISDVKSIAMYRERSCMKSEPMPERWDGVLDSQCEEYLERRDSPPINKMKDMRTPKLEVREC